MEYHILASGSKGNSTFIYEDGTGILIDCGISRKQLLYRLSTLGFQESDITYVLVTHSHYDHTKNIAIFHPSLVYGGEGCVPTLLESNYLTAYCPIQLGAFEVLPLALSHDAKAPLAFVLSSHQKILYMTDTGYVSRKNLNYIKDLDYYIIESNHDVEMLMESSRPLFLKNRIVGDEGHLDNAYSAKTMVEVIGTNTKEIVLAHLSEEANTPQCAKDTYLKIFQENNILFDCIKIASQVNIVSGGCIHVD